MRFEVRYPTGAPHEVELQGTVAVLGRDPSCDLVLADPKCSRRHAVLEAGPQGIAIRDAGSANGTFVNGKKIERAQLQDGDVVRLGDCQLKVLPEEVAGTVVMGPDDMPESPAPPAVHRQAAQEPPLPPAPMRPSSPPASRSVALPPRSPQPAAPPVPPAQPPPVVPPPPLSVLARPQATASARTHEARGEAAGPIPRPLTVSVLGGLWIVSGLAYAVGGISLVAFGGLKGGFAIGAGLAATALVVGLSGLMAWGLLTLKAWARPLQMVLAALPVVGLCGPFILACGAVLAYLLRPEAKILFSGARDWRELSAPDAALLRRGMPEPLFTGAMLGGVGLAVVVTALAAALGLPVRGRAAAGQELALSRLRGMGAAQEQFKTGNCGTGYADLEGLLHPETVIPRISPGAGGFLSPEYAQAEQGGYHFDLKVEDPLPPMEGCPTRSFRRYQYLAVPAGGRGASFLLGSDGFIRRADDRPATLDDPPLP